MNARYWMLMLSLGSSGTAWAQTTATRPQTIGAAPRINNQAAPQRQISIRLGAEVSYDSNVFGLSKEAERRGLLRNRSKDDFSLTPTLQLNILLPLGRNSVFARGALGYDFYLDNSSLNRERINLDGGGSVQIASRCALQPTASYVRSRSNAGDIFVVSPIPLTDRTNTEERISYGIEGSCGGVIGLSPSLGYRRTQIRNDSPLFEPNDVDQDSIDGSIGYSRPSLGRVSIYGSYTESRYRNRTILGLPGPIPGIPNEQVTSYSAGARFERNIGSRASGAISIGYSWVDPNSLIARRFRGNSYSLSFNLRPSDRLSVDVLASRSADVSNTVFSSFAVTDIYSLNGSYRLSPRLNLNFGASHQSRDFRGQSLTPDLISAVDSDEFARAFGGVSFDLNRRLRLNALVSQQKRSSGNALFTYTNTTVSAGASLALGR